VIRLLPPQDLKRSGFVARVFGLRDVVLTELSASRGAPLQIVATDESSRISVNVKDSADAVLAEDGSSLLANVRFEVTAKHADHVVVKVTGQFELRYDRQVDEEAVTLEDAQLFSRINGFYNAWPYMRELVANTFVRMGYPPFTMESLVIGPQPDESKAAAKSAKPAKSAKS
jgi:hypothetical protein